MTDYMLKMWKLLSEIGSTPEMTHGQIKRLRMVNRTSVVCILIFFLPTLRYLNADQNLSAIIQVFTTLGMIGVLSLNYFKRYNAARFFILFNANLNLLVTCSFMGAEAGEHMAFFAISMFIPLIFDVKREIPAMIVGFGMTALCMAWLFLTDFHALPIREAIDPTVLAESSNGNFVITIILVLVVSVNYQRFSGDEVKEIQEKGRRQLQQAFDRSYNGTMLVDSRNFEILECNARMKELFGVELLLNQTSDLDHLQLPHLNSLGLQQLIAELDGSHRSSREYYFDLQGSRSFWGQLSLTYFRYQDQDQLLIQISDISQLKAHEAEIILAKERAESANIAKAHFLDNMSHEFRTPINGINGIAEIIEAEYPQDDSLQQYSHLLLASGNRLLRTMNLVLDLSHLESGKTDVDAKPYKVYDLIQEGVELMQSEISASGLAFEYPSQSSGHSILVNKTLFLDALVHLLSNALKFTERGQVSIKVLARREHANDYSTVSICVEDTGVGMSPEFVSEKLFRKFEQESTGLDRDYEGAGLGLSITKRIVEIMGGTIHVWSVPEVGSTFELRFAEWVTESEQVPSLRTE